MKYAGVLLFLASAVVSSQTVTVNLRDGNCLRFRGEVYAYGLAEREGDVYLKIHRYAGFLSPIDSLEVPLGKEKTGALLPPDADSSAGFLSFAIYTKGKGSASIVRFGDNLRVQSNKDYVSTARLGNFQQFGGDILKDGVRQYSMRAVNDSGGKQFYLNRHDLDTALNEFRHTWQYPFERKNVAFARPVLANARHVYVLAAVDSSVKAGEWLLKIDAIKGSLVKAVKLNAAKTGARYGFGAIIPGKTGELMMCGQLLGRKDAALYLVAIDSLMEIRSKTEHPLRFTPPKKCEGEDCVPLIRISGCTMRDGTVRAQADIYQYIDSCATFAGSADIALHPEATGAAGAIETITAVTKFFDGSLSGKLCAPGHFLSSYFAQAASPGRLYYSGGKYLLLKQDRLRGKIVCAVIRAGKKGMATQILLEADPSQRPRVLAIDEKTYLTGCDNGVGGYKMELHAW